VVAPGLSSQSVPFIVRRLADVAADPAKPAEPAKPAPEVKAKAKAPGASRPRKAKA
jgi:hypothetical protein